MVKIYGYSDDTVCLDNSKYFEGQQPRPNRFAGYGRGLRGNP